MSGQLPVQTSTPGRLTHVAPVAVLLLALLPMAAQASCGRHVSYPGDTAEDRRPPAPCRGPSCSDNRDPSPLLPPVTTYLAAEQDAAVLSSSLLNLASSRRLTPREAISRPIHHALPPDPPPRLRPHS